MKQERKIGNRNFFFNTCSLRHNFYNQVLQEHFWTYDVIIAFTFCDPVDYADVITNTLRLNINLLLWGLNLYASILMNYI